MMYHLSYLDIKHGIQRGGGQFDPPSISWFSSTPAEIGLKCCSTMFISFTSLVALIIYVLEMQTNYIQRAQVRLLIFIQPGISQNFPNSFLAFENFLGISREKVLLTDFREISQKFSEISPPILSSFCGRTWVSLDLILYYHKLDKSQSSHL